MAFDCFFLLLPFFCLSMRSTITFLRLNWMHYYFASARRVSRHVLSSSFVVLCWVSWDLLPIFPSIHRQSVGAHGWSWNWFAKGKIVLLGAFLFRGGDCLNQIEMVALLRSLPFRSMRSFHSINARPIWTPQQPILSMRDKKEARLRIRPMKASNWANTYRESLFLRYFCLLVSLLQ